MAIFNSYVKLPEGNYLFFCFNMFPICVMTRDVDVEPFDQFASPVYEKMRILNLVDWEPVLHNPQLSHPSKIPTCYHL